MKSTFAYTSFLAAVVAMPLLVGQHVARGQTGPVLASLDLTGPYVYQNLAIFAVHDKNASKHDEILTLQEALAKNAVTVEETGNVNQLQASNRGKQSVYLQSGDIVKGGRQDRVLQHDTLLPPGSKKVALSVFCVESGRWQGRGAEPSQRFASSNAALVTKGQKMAVKLAGNQGEVWNSVAVAQSQIGGKLGKSVRAPASATSLQLSLEDKQLGESVEDYVRNIEKQIPAQDDLVGYAVALNGKVDSIDVFASPNLFGKMKGKLLKSSATEAVASKTNQPTPPPSTEAVQGLIADAESGAARAEKQNLRTRVSRKETAKNVVFTTDDPLISGKSVHKNYLAK